MSEDHPDAVSVAIVDRTTGGVVDQTITGHGTDFADDWARTAVARHMAGLKGWSDPATLEKAFNERYEVRATAGGKPIKTQAVTSYVAQKLATNAKSGGVEAMYPSMAVSRDQARREAATTGQAASGPLPAMAQLSRQMLASGRSLLPLVPPSAPDQARAALRQQQAAALRATARRR